MSDTTLRTDARSGLLLGGRYRMQDVIASGGMAKVYRATDEILSRPVAVKVMHPGLAEDATFVERFRREAQNAARLNHPNVVTVHDCGEQGDAVFIVMELVEGTSLRDLVERFGRVDADTARHIVTGVAAALDHAHAKGLVHRDVKPENVLITADGHVKVVDFGVAYALAEQGARLTGDRAVGTMSYIAPEQLTSGQVDARADVYALGIMAYEILTGRLPFDGDTPAAVAAARLERSVPSPGVDARTDAAIARATARQPGDRFETAGEFSRALGEGTMTHLHDTSEVSRPAVSTVTTVIDLDQPTTKRPKRGPRTKRTPSARTDRRRRWPWALGLALLLAAAAAGAYNIAPRTTQIPDVSGMTRDGAAATLRSAGLSIGDVTEAFSEHAAAGSVLVQDPAPEMEVDRGSAVDLVLSKGPRPLPIPDVVGSSRQEAEETITAAGLAVGEITEVHDDASPGTVIGQDPTEGEAPRGTAIALTVSKGPELVRVPDVAGKSPEEAAQAIGAAGLTAVRGEAYSDSVPEGTVTGSTPSAGNMAPKGSEIRYVVSKGPKPFPMPDLVGMQLEAAEAKAESLGLVVANTYAVPGSGRESGEVQGQNPPAGTEVRRGASIDLYHAT